MVEAQSMARLLGPEEEETKDAVGPSLRSMTSEALANPRVREMLDAFRNGGPESLARFVGDPAYNASLDTVRGTARQLDLPSTLPVATGTIVSPPEQRRRRVLVGVSGSVAAVKVPELVVALSSFADVKVAATERGWHFMEKGRTSRYDETARQQFDALVAEGKVAVLRDSDEWDAWTALGDEVLHVELKKWADLILVAPLSANTLSKLAQGACDDLLTCTLRAAHGTPLVLAPAMNTAMWSHPFTTSQLAVCTRLLHATVVDPVAKTLACGDTGRGALAPVSALLHAVRTKLPPSDGGQHGEDAYEES